MLSLNDLVAREPRLVRVNRVIHLAANAMLLALISSSLVGCAKPRTESVLLVVVDTLRADHLGFSGYGRDTSPELDALARDGIVFDQAYASSPWTLPSVGSILTGLTPSHHGGGALNPDLEGLASIQPLSRNVRLLSELLAARGWQTGAVINNPVLSESFGFRQGFSHWDYDPGTRAAQAAVDAALAWLEAHRHESFFLFVHLFDPHLPYDAPEPAFGRFGEGSRPKLRLEPVHLIRRRLADGDSIDMEGLEAEHDAEIWYADREIGRLLDGLTTFDLEHETLVIVTSDHGEEFLDHGGFEHGHTLYEELIHVPLILVGPAIQSRRVSTPVSHVDIVPTVLDLLDIPAPGDVDGQSLWRRAPRRAVSSEFLLYPEETKALVAWPWKLIWTRSTGEVDLHDLSVDPEETRDLSTINSNRTSAMLHELRKRTSDISGDHRPTEGVDDETRDRLRALGYLE